MATAAAARANCTRNGMTRASSLGFATAGSGDGADTAFGVTGHWFWRSDFACHERDAGVAKRLKHALKLGIGHEADLLVFLAVQLAQPREFHRGAGFQLLLEVAPPRPRRP